MLLFKPSLGLCVPDSPTPIAVSTKLSLFTTLGLISESFVNFSFHLWCHYPFQSCMALHEVFPPFTVRLPTGAMNPAWFLSSRENSSVASQYLQFPGQPLQPYSDGTDSTSNVSHVLWCNFFHVNCPSGYHHLHVHRFVSRTLQHFSTVEY